MRIDVADLAPVPSRCAQSALFRFKVGVMPMLGA
jgi:hypothetical protein